MTSADPSPTPRWRRVVGSFWFQLIAAFVVAGLILSFVAKPYWVPSGSMEATLEPGDRILVNRLAYVGAEPGTGDIVVFDAGTAWEDPPQSDGNPLKAVLRWLGEATGFGPSSPHTLVKRVIGTPGDIVACCTDAGEITVNGEPLDEPYVTNDLPFAPAALDCTTTPRSTRCFDAVIVPDDSYLVLGDNRAASADSAIACRTPDAMADCWRWASNTGLVGKAVMILWPISRWTGL